MSKLDVSVAARIFSSGVVREMAKYGASPAFARLCKQSEFSRKIDASTVHDFFQKVFDFLKLPEHRNEYTYKAALTQRILLGVHSLRTACMINEFRVGDAKADLVILNGTATVYEIKSERDSLARLSGQLRAYRDVFPQVCVIAGKNHLEEILDKVPSDVGVMELGKRYQIKVIREPLSSLEFVKPSAVFDAIRIQEAGQVLRLYGIDISDIPNIHLAARMREEFCQLETKQVVDGMLKILKKTRSNKALGSLLSELPSSLHAAAIATSPRAAEQYRLVSAMRTNMQDAINWG